MLQLAMIYIALRTASRKASASASYCNYSLQLESRFMYASEKLHELVNEDGIELDLAD